MFFFTVAVVSEGRGHEEDDSNKNLSQENLKEEKYEASSDSLEDKCPKR